MMLTMLLKDKADKTGARLDLKPLLSATRPSLVSAGGPGAPNETGWSSRGGHNESCG